MPFSMIETALGGSFLLVWLFIGAMMLGDRMAQVRRGLSGEPERPRKKPRRPKYRARRPTAAGV